FSLHHATPHRYLHSFPTRRSSDLLERMRQVAIARINTLRHLSPDTPLPPAPKKMPLGGSLPPVETLRAQALAQRPDLRALAESLDRKSTRLNSSHDQISYAVFCLK